MNIPIYMHIPTFIYRIGTNTWLDNGACEYGVRISIEYKTDCLFIKISCSCIQYGYVDRYIDMDLQ